MVAIVAELMICHDCACVVANDECVRINDAGYYDAVEEIKAAWSEQGLDWLRLVVACNESEDESECPVSKSPCGACGDTDEGWRHAAVLFDS